MSFQRRVGSANRGAIPYVEFDTSFGWSRVLIPLRVGEALWVAVVTELQIIVEGHAGERPLGVEKLPAGNQENLQMLGAVLDQGRWLPIDTNSVVVADDPDTIGDGLTVVVSNSLTAATQRIAIAPVTPALYSELSGLPAPEITTERDGYGGWRLP